MFGLKKRKPHGELKLSDGVDKIEVDLLAGDLPFHKGFFEHVKGSIKKEELFGEIEKSFCRSEIKNGAVSEVLETWCSLPKGEPMRCFTPGYKVTFYIFQEVEKIATICWACNHIKILDKSGEEIWFTVDGESKEADKLLKICRNAVKNKM